MVLKVFIAKYHRFHLVLLCNGFLQHFIHVYDFFQKLNYLLF